MVANLGLKIKARRKELGMTQTELANKIGNNSPNARSYISKIENGDDNLTTIMIKKLAEALETTPMYLLGLNESDKQNENYMDYISELAVEDAEILKMYHQLDIESRTVIKSTMTALLKNREGK